jgi:hypothetical protein
VIGLRTPCFAALTAALACAVLAASAAGANLNQRPEIGRCAPVPNPVTEGGEYRGGRCLKARPGHGWNWSSGPGAARNFTGTFSGAIVLETHGTAKFAITCTSGTQHGEITGPKSISVSTTVLQGCRKPATLPIEQLCQNTGSKNGEISWHAMTGELAYVSRTVKFRVGINLQPAVGIALATFECGGASESLGTGTGTGTSYELQGSVIGQVTGLNYMSSSQHSLTFALKAGAQWPQKFETGVAHTLTLVSGVTSEPATLVGSEGIATEEPLEVLVR